MANLSTRRRRFRPGVTCTSTLIGARRFPSSWRTVITCKSSFVPPRRRAPDAPCTCDTAPCSASWRRARVPPSRRLRRRRRRRRRHRTSSWDTLRRIILESARPPRRINGRRSRDPIDRACPRTRGARDASATRRIPTRRRCVRAPAVETSSSSSTPATPWVKRYFTGR